MRLERITLTHVSIPLLEPLRIASGEVSEKDGLLLRVEAGGIAGVGEASPMSGTFYSEETPESVWKFLSERLIPAAIAAGADSVSAINRVLDRAGGSPRVHALHWRPRSGTWRPARPGNPCTIFSAGTTSPWSPVWRSASPGGSRR
jgi:L-alanine-DL-glutamate epimerase-like enolase superfamily enzyme